LPDLYWKRKRKEEDNFQGKLLIENVYGKDYISFFIENDQVMFQL
jgi:hypothetical protein